jgi:ribosomal protein L20
MLPGNLMLALYRETAAETYRIASQAISKAVQLEYVSRKYEAIACKGYQSVKSPSR